MKRGVWIVGAAVAAVVAVVLMLGEPDVPSADASGPGVVREPARPVAGVAVERVEVVDAKEDAVVGAEGVAPDQEEEAPRHPASWAPMLARLRGIAWFAGAPRGDLSVEWLDSSNVPRRSTTAPDGSFVIEGLLPGDGGVLWIDRRGPNATKREVTLPPVRGADRDLGIVRLDARGTVTGRVVDGNGRPIAEAWIRAFAPNELEGGAAPPRPVAHVDVWRFGPGEPWGVERLGEDATDDPSIGRPSTRSAEDGTFRISGPLRHDDRLVVQHSDHRPATIGPFGVRFDRPSDAGDVVLGEGRVVRGAVVDAAGAPAADVELFVGRLESVFGRQEDVDTDEAVATARRGKLRLAAVTDGRGRFTARGCDDDADAIAARSRDGGAWIVLHPIPDGELTLRLVERAELRLTVTDEHGAPIRGARAEAMPTEYGGSLEAFLHPEASEADGAGRIVLRGLRPGSHQVTVTSPGHVDRTLEVDLPTSGATEVPVRLESGLTLRVRVVDGSGVPISDARLTCVEATDWSDIDTRTLLSYSFRLPESHSSSEDGDVTLHGLAARKHTLNVSHPAYTARELEVELPLDSEAMEVVLGAGGRIVCRPDEHLPPLPHPRRVQLRGPIWCAIETDGRGGFVVEGLAPGEYELHLWNDEEGWSMPERGRSPFDMHTTAETVEARVEEGETTYVTFLTFSDPPAAPGRVHGRVVVDGAPAAGWTVELDARDAGIRGARRVTDHAGRFDYPRVAPGRVQVSVPQPDIPAIVFPFDLAGRSVRLAPGAEEFVELSFFTGRAEGRVLDAATGAPLGDYLDRVRARFAQWILDTADAEFDGEWLRWQLEIGRRHHRVGKNRTDGASSSAIVPYRYLPLLAQPIVDTLRPFLSAEGIPTEEVDAMQNAWRKAVLLQVTLWSQPYVAKEDF